MDKEIADQFNKIAQKRRVLEHLQTFIKQLHTMMASMEPVQQILKPSQKPSAKAQKALDQLMGPFETRSADQLKRTLTALDKEVDISLGFILKVAEDSVDGYSGRMAKLTRSDFVSAHHLLIEKMRDFRRKAQTDVAVRLTMHKRGILEHAGKLPISQDTLNEKVSLIRNQETICKRKIIDKAREIIKDINTIADNDACPDELKGELASFKSQLKDNLQRLKEGKSIEAMPAIFEELSIEEASPASPYPLPPMDDPQEASATPAQAPREEDANHYIEDESHDEDQVEEDQYEEAGNDQANEESHYDESLNDDNEAYNEEERNADPTNNTKRSSATKELTLESMEEPEKKKMGFFKRTFKWLMSPWSVSWRDIDK